MKLEVSVSSMMSRRSFVLERYFVDSLRKERITSSMSSDDTLWLVTGAPRAVVTVSGRISSVDWTSANESSEPDAVVLATC